MGLVQEDRANGGTITVSPLVTVLVRRLEERWTGTLLVDRDGDETLAAVRCEAGMVVAARARGLAGTLLEQVCELCTLEEARIVEVDRADLVGGHTRELVDPVRAIAAAVRGPLRQEVADQVVQVIGNDVLRLHPQVELERYALERAELQTVAALEPAPLDLDELRARSRLPEPRLRRLLCALLATRALTVVPAWKRIASGEISHAPTLASLDPRARDDEPTAVVVLDALARERAARAAKLPSRKANSTHLEYLPKPMSRARFSRPASSERPAVPYSVRHPRSGIEVARSTLPPSVASRSVPPAGRNDADALFRRAQTLLAQGNPRGAVFEAQRAMKLASPRPAQRALYAWLLYERAGSGEPVPPPAWSHLAQALEDDPACATAHYYQGVLLARTGRVRDAIAHLERALELEPAHEPAAAELRRCRRR